MGGLIRKEPLLSSFPAGGIPDLNGIIYAHILHSHLVNFQRSQRWNLKCLHMDRKKLIQFSHAKNAIKKGIDLYCFLRRKIPGRVNTSPENVGNSSKTGGRRLQNSHNIQYLICHRWLTQYTLFPTKGGWSLDEYGEEQ